MRSNSWSCSGVLSRRKLLESAGLGMGSLALACLLKDEGLLGAEAAPYNDIRPRPGHFPGQATAIIQLYQEGGPSQVDLFDPKPELAKRNGQPVPGDVEAMLTNNRNVLMASADYGTRCLMARRLIESGVRVVQVIAPLEGNQWDHHGQIRESLTKMCAATDQPAAALIKDLKRRGLLDSTLVMWCGEFGRLPTTENADGRDHNRHGFSLFLAGGGFRAGCIYGATDDFGYKALVNRVSVPDLHATVLNQLGLDHQRLWYPHHGRKETLTDVTVSGARVVRELIG